MESVLIHLPQSSRAKSVGRIATPATRAAGGGSLGGRGLGREAEKEGGAVPARGAGEASRALLPFWISQRRVFSRRSENTDKWVQSCFCQVRSSETDHRLFTKKRGFHTERWKGVNLEQRTLLQMDTGSFRTNPTPLFSRFL